MYFMKYPMRAKITIYNSQTNEIEAVFDAKCVEDAYAQYWSWQRVTERNKLNKIPHENSSSVLRKN